MGQAATAARNFTIRINRHFARNAFIALVFFATARASMGIAQFADVVAPFWIPTGLVLAAALKWGRGILWGAAIGAMADAFVGTRDLPAAALITIGNVVGVYAIAYLVARTRIYGVIDRVRNTFLYVTIVVIGCAIGGVVGSLGVSLTPMASKTPWIETFSVWFASDVTACILITPILILAPKLSEHTWDRRDITHAVAIASVLLITTYFSFSYLYDWFPFAPTLPLLLVALWRFGIGGGLIAMALQAPVTTYSFFHSVPEYLEGGIFAASLNFQFATATIAAAGLFAGALMNEREVTQRAFIERQRRFAGIVRNLSDAVLLLDENFKVHYASPATQRLTGLRLEDLMSKHRADVVHPDDLPVLAEAMFEVLAESGATRSVNARIAHEDDTWRWTEITTDNALHDADIRSLVVTVRDIHQRVEIEEALHDSEKMRAIGELAGGVAHDFNNLLTTILNYSQFVADTMDDKDKRREDLSQVTQAAQLGSRLTRQLLTIASKDRSEPETVDLNAHIEKMRPLLRSTMGRHRRLDLELAPDLPSVYLDPVQLEQVLLNLVVNARDAIEESGRVQIKTREENGTVVLVVRDNGRGMDRATQSRVFEPFFSTKPKGKGTGLGLATAHGVIAGAGGSIEVDSLLGFGTTFIVSLPAQAAPSKDVNSSGPQMQTVLVVDDDEGVREIASRILRTAGFEVDHYGSAAEAISAMHRRKDYDLLLTDVVMPVMSGYQLAAISKVPTLLMSGYTGTEENGSDLPIVSKPFTNTELISAVQDRLQVSHA